MNERQIDALLREIFGFLKNKLFISDEEWRKQIEPRIKEAAKRISGIEDDPES